MNSTLIHILLEERMRAAKTIIWMLLLPFLFACSAVQVSQDYLNNSRFFDLKTYRWKSDKQKTTGNSQIDNPFLVKRIRSAIEETLSANGYKKIPEGKPDFYVSYNYALKSKIESRDNGTSFGFGFGSFGSFGRLGINTGQEIRQYDQAILTIDFINPENDELLWRGMGSRRAAEHTTPEKITRSVNEMVTKILDQFPPLPG